MGESSAGHLRRRRTLLVDEWIRQIVDAGLAPALTREEIAARVGPIYDAYVESLEAGTSEAFRASAQGLLDPGRPRIETHAAIGVLLLLHDVVTPALLSETQSDLRAIVDVPELAASRMALRAATALVQDRERAIREEQDAIRDLSTPLLPVRDRLLLLPLVGALDPRRARQLTEQVLRGVRTHRAKVVVIDMTGVPALDAAAASYLVQTADASGLLGATVIMSGLSAELAHQLVSLGVDLGRVTTVGDLQSALEEAERHLASPPNARGPRPRAAWRA